MHIKTAIIGLGGIGLNYDYNLKNFFYSHAKCLEKNKNFKLCFGVDHDYTQLKKFNKKYKIDCFQDLKEGFKKFSPEFVVISVPTEKHYDVFQKVIKYKFVRFILLEKPGGSNYSELKKMIDIAKKKKIKLFVNYPRLYSNYYSKLIINLKKSFKFNIFVFYSRGISNNCSHYISFLNLFLKKIIKINILKIHKKFANDFQADFELYYKNAKITFVHNNHKDLLHTEILINSDKGKWLSVKSFSEFLFFRRKNNFQIKGAFDYDNKFLLLKNYQNSLLNNVYNKIYSHIKKKSSLKSKYKNFLQTHKTIENIKNKIVNFR